MCSMLLSVTENVHSKMLYKRAMNCKSKFISTETFTYSHFVLTITTWSCIRGIYLDRLIYCMLCNCVGRYIERHCILLDLVWLFLECFKEWFGLRYELWIISDTLGFVLVNPEFLIDGSIEANVFYLHQQILRKFRWLRLLEYVIRNLGTYPYV